MNQRRLGTSFLFLLCDINQAARLSLRKSLAASTKAIEDTVPGFHKLYDLDNTVDQLSLTGSALGACNTNIAKRLHITLFPLILGQVHQIKQFESNLTRRMKLWTPPEKLVTKGNVLSAMLGDDGGKGAGGARIKLAMELRFEIMTLKTPNVLFVVSRCRITPESELLLKGLSCLIGEQADNLNLKYDWWNNVGVKGIDECKYHVSFMTYNLKRPGTAVSFKQISDIQSAFKKLPPVSNLSIETDSMVVVGTNQRYFKVPLA